METDGVLNGIQQNNPAITAVHLDVFDEAVDDWAAAGNCIGSNRYLRFLSLGMNAMDRVHLEAFFGGLALNRSIQALKIGLSYWDDYDGQDSYIKEVFEALLRWFQFNDNLQVFDLWCSHEDSNVNAAVSSRIKDAILACPSLKSIQLCCRQADWGVIARSISAKSKIQHLSLTGGFLSRDACAHIKSLLSDKRCILRSLTLGNHNADLCGDLDDLEEIINGMSNNQSLRYLGLLLNGRCSIHSGKSNLVPLKSSSSHAILIQLSDSRPCMNLVVRCPISTASPFLVWVLIQLRKAQSTLLRLASLLRYASSV
jgi:hypothetical protein